MGPRFGALPEGLRICVEAMEASLAEADPTPGRRFNPSEAFPAILQRAGKAACLAADEFFAAKISNPHTRRTYARPVGRFLAWCEAQGIELRQSRW